ncbi:hypothetical protein [Campylobacter hominis]
MKFLKIILLGLFLCGSMAYGGGGCQGLSERIFNLQNGNTVTGHATNGFVTYFTYKAENTGRITLQITNSHPVPINWKIGVSQKKGDCTNMQNKAKDPLLSDAKFDVEKDKTYYIYMVPETARTEGFDFNAKIKFIPNTAGYITCKQGSSNGGELKPGQENIINADSNNLTFYHYRPNQNGTMYFPKFDNIEVVILKNYTSNCDMANSMSYYKLDVERTIDLENGEDYYIYFKKIAGKNDVNNGRITPKFPYSNSGNVIVPDEDKECNLMKEFTNFKSDLNWPDCNDGPHAFCMNFKSWLPANRYLSNGYIKLKPFSDGKLVAKNLDQATKNTRFEITQIAPTGNRCPIRHEVTEYEVKQGETYYVLINYADNGRYHYALDLIPKGSPGGNPGVSSCKDMIGIPSTVSTDNAPNCDHGFCKEIKTTNTMNGYFRIIPDSNGNLSVGTDNSNVKVSISKTGPVAGAVCPVEPVKSSDSLDNAKKGEIYYVYVSGATSEYNIYADIKNLCAIKPYIIKDRITNDITKYVELVSDDNKTINFDSNYLKISIPNTIAKDFSMTVSSPTNVIKFGDISTKNEDNCKNASQKSVSYTFSQNFKGDLYIPFGGSISKTDKHIQIKFKSPNSPANTDEANWNDTDLCSNALSAALISNDTKILSLNRIIDGVEYKKVNYKLSYITLDLSQVKNDSSVIEITSPNGQIKFGDFKLNDNECSPASLKSLKFSMNSIKNYDKKIYIPISGSSTGGDDIKITVNSNLDNNKKCFETFRRAGISTSGVVANYDKTRNAYIFSGIYDFQTDKSSPFKFEREHFFKYHADSNGTIEVKAFKFEDGKQGAEANDVNLYITTKNPGLNDYESCPATSNLKNLRVTEGEDYYIYFDNTNNDVDMRYIELKFTPDKTPDHNSGGTDVNGGTDQTGLIKPEDVEVKEKSVPFGNAYPARFKYITNVDFQVDDKGDNDPSNDTIQYVTMKDDTGGYFDRASINGNYVIIGNRVNSSNGVNFDRANMGNLREDTGFRTNSSRAKIKLPPNIKAKDIKYAKLFWSGLLQKGRNKSNSWTNCGSNPSDRYLDFKNYLLDEIKGYDSAKFRIADGNIKSTDFVSRPNKQTYYFGSTDDCGGWNFSYTSSVDIVNEIREYVKAEIENSATNKEAEFDFTAGDILFSTGPTSGMSLLTGDAVSPGGNIIRGKYGNWALVIVYDKGNDAPSKGEDYYAYYKPRSVVIYKGLGLQSAPSGGNLLSFTSGNGNQYATNDINKVTAKSTLTMTFDGFFTPFADKYNTKLSIYGSSGSKENTGEMVAAKSMDENEYSYKNLYNEANPSMFNNDNTLVNYFDGKGQLNGTANDLIVDCAGGASTDSCDYKFSEIVGQKGELGFDIDTYNLNGLGIMKRNNTGINLKVMTYWVSSGNWSAADVFIPSVVAFSTDIYVPELCYIDRVYDAKGWFNWYKYKYDKDVTNEEEAAEASIKDIVKKPDPVEKIKDIRQERKTVIAGQELYYRTIFLNQAKNETAAQSVVINVDTKDNTYTENSVGIDNMHNSTDIYENKNTVYLRDNETGYYDNILRTGGAIKADQVQYMDYRDRSPRLYLGKGAGDIIGGIPNGGDFTRFDKTNYAAFAEFNATVGNSFKLSAIEYKVGYVVKNDGGEIIADLRKHPVKIKRCDVDSDYEKETRKNVNTILPLDGLKIVNQNVSEALRPKDGNIALEQDERLYTQVAELPFRVNLVFSPNLYASRNFDELCSLFDGVTGNCLIYDAEKIKTEADKGVDFGDFFEKDANGNFTGLTNQFTKMPFDGDVYVSVVTLDAAKSYADKNGVYCKNLKDKDKVKFCVSKNLTDDKCDKYDTIDYRIGTIDKNKVLFEPFSVSLPDAFDRVTFMVSYKPSKEFGIGSGVGSIFTTIQDLQKKQADKTITDAETAELENALNKINKIQQIQDALGVPVSDDGVFRVCKSTFFTVRPASFTIVKPTGKKVTDEMYKTALNGFDKFAKLVNFSGTGDITRGNNAISNDKILRIAGDYKENKDVMYKIYPQSYLNNPVVNYYHIFGGDFNNRISLRGGLDLSDFGKYKKIINTKTGKLETTEITKDVVNDDVIIEDKNALVPFISNECVKHMDSTAFYGLKDGRVNVISSKGLSNDSCNKAIQYRNFKFNGRKYKYEGSGIDLNVKADCADRYRFGGDTVLGSRIWDINGVPLKIQFDLRNLQSSIDDDGQVSNAEKKKARINRSWRYLLDQINGGVSSRDSRPGFISIPSASRDGKSKGTDAKDLKDEMFNYFNVGDVKVNIVDNTFTRQDQQWIKSISTNKRRPDRGPLCVLNSTSNAHTKASDENGYIKPGMVGCDTTMADNKFLVLRYQPKKIDVSISDLQNKNSIPNTKGFTYYNEPFTEGNTFDYDRKDISSVNNAVVDAENTQLANLNIFAMALIDDNVFDSIDANGVTLASLYDGTVIRGHVLSGSTADIPYDVPRCGFSNNINFSLLFDPFADINDDRHTSNVGLTTQVSRNQTICYGYDGRGNCLNITTPNFTQMSKEECEKTGNFDIRCMMSVSRVNESNILQSNFPAESKPFAYPIQNAISYYSDSLTNNFEINSFRTANANGIYSNKSSDYTILARAFDNGVISNKPVVYMNFDRPQKVEKNNFDGQFPVFLTIEDFGLENLHIVDKLKTPSFDTDYDLVNIKNGKLISSPGTFTGAPFDKSNGYESIKIGKGAEISSMSLGAYARQYFRTACPASPVACEKAASKNIAKTEFLRQNQPYALFVYGALHLDDAIKPGRVSLKHGGEKIYPYDRVKYEIETKTNPDGLEKNLYSVVFCNKINNCTGIPNKIAGYGVKNTLFTELAADRNFPTSGKIGNRYMVNIFDNNNVNVFEKYPWAGRTINNPQTNQNPRATESLVTVNSIMNRGVESIRIGYDKDNDKGEKEIRFMVRPWLEFANENDRYLFINSGDFLGKNARPQYFNAFNIEVFSITGNWGGEGSIKGIDSKKSVETNKENSNYVGSFSGADKENKFKHEPKGLDKDGIKRRRMDW